MNFGSSFHRGKSSSDGSGDKQRLICAALEDCRDNRARFVSWSWSSTVTSSWCDCSGEAELEAALRSKSSKRRLSFLPRVGISGRAGRIRLGSLTIVALGDSILYAPSLCKIGDLGPVFVGVGTGTEGAARAVTGGISVVSSGLIRVGVAVRVFHCVCWGGVWEERAGVRGRGRDHLF